MKGVLKSYGVNGNSKIKVSVVVPCCNVEKFLHQCLDSIVSQTLKEIEIICVNDGSKDGTLDIIKEYAAKDARVHIIDKPNSGYGDSMNKGFAIARGEYIGIVESDDYIENDMFERLYATAKKHDAEIVKSSFWLYWAEKSENHFYECLPANECNKVIIPSEYKNGLLYRLKPSIWSAIYKRSFLKANYISFLPTPGASYQDTSFTFKAFSSCKRFVMVHDAFLHYRQDNAGSSVNNADKKAYCVCDEYSEIDKFVNNGTQKNELYPIYAAAFYDACIWMYEKLSIVKRYEFLKYISPWFKKIVNDLGADKIYFGDEWWKRRDIQRIANDPFEYHMWRNVERYEQSGSQFKYKETHTPVNNAGKLLTERKKKFKTIGEPTFSVIIPVYNCEKYLRSCLESLLFQTDKDFEAICVNDGSTDNSLAIIEEYASIDDRFVVVNNENAGPSVARNTGIDIACGKYIMFLDSDDYYSENTFERLKKALNTTKPVDAVLFGTNIFPASPRASDWHYSVLATPDSYFEKIDQHTLLTTPYLKVYTWRFCFSHAFMDKYGIRFQSQYKYGEDAILVLTALPKLHGLASISDKLYNYRHYRPDSLMNQINKDYVKYTKEQLRALDAIITVSVKAFGASSVELLEYSCDFIYSCISNCPEPQRTGYIGDFVKLIKKKHLNKYSNKASDNCKGFWLYCVNRIKEVKSLKNRILTIKRIASKFVPPSRKLFHDRVDNLENLLRESLRNTENLANKINELENICTEQREAISRMEQLLKKDK